MAGDLYLRTGGRSEKQKMVIILIPMINDDWYDSDDSPTDMVLDLSNVTIDKTSQPKRMQEKFLRLQFSGVEILS